MRSKISILIADPLAKEGIDLLTQQEDFHLTVLEKTLPESELLDLIGSYDVLVVRSATKVNHKIIDAGRKLKLIARAGTGLDNIDVQRAKEYSISVINSPHANSISTAEHTFALLMSLVRKISWAYQSVLDGNWDRKSYQGMQLYGKTLGIVGLGRIGTELAKRSKAFGMHIEAYDPYVPPERFYALDIEPRELNFLLKHADILTLHIPLTEETENLITKTELLQMKPTAILINCARGGLLDEKDLYDVLVKGHLKGVALDTLENEPPNKDYPLLQLPNVLCTPHLGASTQEAQRLSSEEIGRAILQFFQKKMS